MAIGPTEDREAQAQREVGVTQISRAQKRALTGAFLALITLVPLLDLARGSASGAVEGARALAAGAVAGGRLIAGGALLAGNRKLLQAMDAFETRLEETTPLRAAVLPGFQWALTAALGTGNEEVYVGRQDWLFLRADVDALTGPRFLDADVLETRRREGKAWEDPREPDSRPAILALARDLAARDIRLVLLPAPGKASVHPARLAPAVDTPAGGLQNASFARWRAELEAQGVLVFDPAPLLVEAARTSGQSQYLEHDSHWTPAAIERVAAALADLLRQGELSPVDATEVYARGAAEVENVGDLARNLELPPQARLFAPQTVALRPVTRGGDAWRPDPAAEILLLGDSFSNVFSEPSLGWGAGAGLAEQLSFELRRPVDRIAINAGGAWSARQRLADELAGGRDRLRGKRVVIYQFAARELAVGDWRQLRLPAAATRVGSAGAGSALGSEASPQSVLRSPGVKPPASPPTLPETALPQGVAVWESNRTGDWRIWTSRLDGSGLRQLSREEPGRQHGCPHISPDGRWVAYLSSSEGKDSYPEPESPGELRLAASDGSQERVLADAARSYSWGHRCAVWKSPRELIHLDGEGRTVLRDILSGTATRLTQEPRRELGYLVDSTLRHATSGEPSFSAYDPARRQVIPSQPLPGCEPYFAADGRWGFWSAGGGGPILRMRLADREVSTLLTRDDPRLPAGRRYVYFSMISRDGRLFAYGASGGEHHHHRADYDIYVAPLHPRSLELRGRPVRLTEHPATDRYPDAWAEPLALGIHAGEAPHTLRLGAEHGGAGEWDFGDGARGGDGTHTYQRAGEYQVTARQGERQLQGSVYIEPAAPPRALSAVAENAGDVVVSFDEAVALAGASVRRAGGQPLAWRPSGDGRSLRIESRERLAAGDRLQVSGVVDRAQRPNAMATATITVEPPPWPSDRTDLAFAWQSAAESTPAFDLDARLLRAFEVEPRGRAHFDRGWEMALPGEAWFEAEAGAGENVVATVRRGRALSLEATLTPSLDRTPALTPIVALGDGPGQHNFLLAQDGEFLVFSLLSGPLGRPSPPLRLFALAAGRTEHVVVTYAPPGEFAVFRNGAAEVPQAGPAGGFARWQARPLIFGRLGGRESGAATWRGTLEGIGLWGRRLSAAEAARNFSLMRQHRSLRGAPPASVAVTARLRACSRTPTLEEISPYRQALIVCEWTPESGSPETLAPQLRVAHWAILDRELQAISTLAPGSTARLRLEPFADHPELEPHVLSDTLGAAPGAALYYALER